MGMNLPFMSVLSYTIDSVFLFRFSSFLQIDFLDKIRLLLSEHTRLLTLVNKCIGLTEVAMLLILLAGHGG